MKMLLSIAALVFVMVPACAEESRQPTVEEVTSQANSLIAAVQAQRNSCNDQVAQLGAQLEKVSKELASLKQKPEQKPGPEKK